MNHVVRQGSGCQLTVIGRVSGDALYESFSSYRTRGHAVGFWSASRIQKRFSHYFCTYVKHTYIHTYIQYVHTYIQYVHSYIQYVHTYIYVTVCPSVESYFSNTYIHVYIHIYTNHLGIVHMWEDLRSLIVPFLIVGAFDLFPKVG